MSPNIPSGTITFLFTDIEGSTQLWEQYPEAMKVALARHDTLLRQAIEAYQGHVFKTVGDAFCAAFPTAPEALAASIAAQRALHAEAWEETPIKVRMALHTGVAVERDGDYFGQPVNRVARLMSAGHGGQTLISASTEQLLRGHLPANAQLRDLGERRLKDLVSAERIFQLWLPDLPADFPVLKTLDSFRMNLPAQLTSFVGRESEMAEVRRRMTWHRLVTLTGPGGTGKTRLSLQVAAELLDVFPHGVWFVELAPIADPALVPQTVATTLGLREEGGRPILTTLTDDLRAKTLLLILDNCEHLVEACAQLAETLLLACPNLRILASSREMLGIAGELPFGVPPLSTPEFRHLPPTEMLAQYESVRLFVERAQTALPTFTVTNENVGAVAQICRRLDGIPLALELAAARVKMLQVEQIAARLDDRFRLLTGGSRTAVPRQRTLQALIDWSHDLLSGPERALLRRLSVFTGGWTLDVAEAICGGEPLEADDVLDWLAQLVNKSLVVVERELGQEVRYDLLETIRQYAQDKLLEANETTRFQRRHCNWFLKFVEQAESELKGPKQSEWLDRLEREYDNLRAALAWSLESEAAVALRLAGALGQYWFVRGHLFNEGREWLEKILSRTATLRHTTARVKAFRWLGILTNLQGDDVAARSAFEKSLTLYRELGDQDGIAETLSLLGDIARSQGDDMAARSFFAEARLTYEKSLASLRERGDKWSIARSLNALGEMARAEGEDDAARLFYEESLTIRRELGDQRGTAVSLLNLSYIAQHQGDYSQVARLIEESLALFQKLGVERGILHCLVVSAGVAGQRGRPAQAARLFGAVEAQHEAFGTRIERPDRIEFDRNLAAVRAQLDEGVFAAAWAEGRAMTIEQAIDYALDEYKGAG